MAWLLGIGVPALLAILSYRLSSRPKTLFALLILVAVLVMIFELSITKGGLRPGSTWMGYAVTLLVPFLFASVAIEATRRARDHRLKKLMAFVCVPLLFWLGFIVGISVAVTLGLAAP